MMRTPIDAADAAAGHLPGRPPGRGIPRRGPRTPREVRDLESYLMRPVPMRRRSGNEQVLGAHARFLQHWFRRTRALADARWRRSPSAPPAWGRGGMRGLLPIYRPVHRPRCTDGIASDADFAEQRRRARRVLMWYRQYAELLRKLQGRQPELVDLFCGEGGVSEGIRRAGLSPNGVDAKDMPKYRDRFGARPSRRCRRLLAGHDEECGGAVEGGGHRCEPAVPTLLDGAGRRLYGDRGPRDPAGRSEPSRIGSSFLGGERPRGRRRRT